MNNICKTEDCTGCFACMNICPRNAISIERDILDKTVPKIDAKKCIDCGLCKKVCPVNTKPVFNKAECAYAAWSKDPDDLNKSASGGIAAVLTRAILNSGGCVFGAASVERETRHICVTTIDEAEKLRGSKYVQSNISFIYRQVKEKLEKEIKVLFIGTPCQVAGLNSYLGKKHKNLLTVDLICHGVVPHKYLQEYLDKKSKGKWDTYSFRGVNDSYITAYQNGVIKYKRYAEHDIYYGGFYNGLFFRENCYQCEYSSCQRVSDITIGDFWGIDRSTLKRKYNGKISVVLPNTEKGHSFWKCIQDKFYSEQRTLEEAANKLQTNLRKPSPKHQERDFFVKNYPKYGFIKTVKRTQLGRKISRLYLKNRIYTALHR